MIGKEIVSSSLDDMQVALKIELNFYFERCTGNMLKLFEFLRQGIDYQAVTVTYGFLLSSS